VLYNEQSIEWPKHSRYREEHFFLHQRLQRRKGGALSSGGGKGTFFILVYLSIFNFNHSTYIKHHTHPPILGRYNLFAFSSAE
jgi:hypothetical protein